VDVIMVIYENVATAAVKMKCGESRGFGFLFEFLFGSGANLECVNTFCYLEDMIGREGGVDEAVKTRVRYAWSKVRELLLILCVRGVSLKLKGKIYKACVQSA
jgi:hypothetical protein